MISSAFPAVFTIESPTTQASNIQNYKLTSWLRSTNSTTVNKTHEYEEKLGNVGG